MIVTLVCIDIGLSWWRRYSPRVEKILDDVPVVLVERGRPLTSRMDRECVDTRDILEAARHQQGLERMTQIKYAVLETNGEISIIPWRSGPDQDRAAPSSEAGR